MSAGLPIIQVDWLDLFLHFMMLSMLSIGGAITTAPEMHRYLVMQHGWLNEAQFNSSIAIAQAAPGPNVLFVALMGWNVGVNAGGIGWGFLGMIVTMAGILLPSTTLTYLATGWAHRNRHLRAVRAFKQGMAPIVIALLVATGWILSSAHQDPARDWGLWALSALAMVVVWRTRLHLIWLLALGAILGAFGIV
ncbi:chromate transporter [Noviherbaspirillum galbum]|uniref:Chromate transporter n=1 Tax=Noviherbaspirillum galbum TaxID=2709383 RepID=A0A6B3SM37_9BURK|nr:chromate transporter [Noviherbaspirillum galbum]NEX61914.1 chromate transporter [Noviherbaspirillum galbum]